MILKRFELVIIGGDSEMGPVEEKSVLDYIGEEMFRRLGETSAVGIKLIEDRTFGEDLPKYPFPKEEDLKKYTEEKRKRKEEMDSIAGEVYRPRNIHAEEIA